MINPHRVIGEVPPDYKTPNSIRLKRFISFFTKKIKLPSFPRRPRHNRVDEINQDIYDFWISYPISIITSIFIVKHKLILTGNSLENIFAKLFVGIVLSLVISSVIITLKYILIIARFAYDIFTKMIKDIKKYFSKIWSDTLNDELWKDKKL